MKIIKCLVSILIFLLFHTVVNAQLDFKPGYVLLKEQDTLFGYIAAQTDNLNCRQCLFSKTEEGKSYKTYTPTEILGYRFTNGRYFVSKTIELEGKNTAVFVEFLVNGISKLYYFKEGDVNSYFVAKNDSVLEKLIYEEVYFVNEFGDEKVRYDERYKGVLKYLYRDCPDIYPRIDNAHFDHNSLIKISKEYHEKVCPDEECIVYTKSTKRKVFFGTKLGLGYSLLGIETSSDFATDLSVNFGAHLRIVPAKVFYRWNFYLGVEYSSVSYSGEFTHTLLEDIYGTGVPDQWSVELKYQMLKIPLKAQYTFPLKKIQPSFYFGYDNILVLKADYNDYGTTNYLGKEGFTKYLSGFIFGIGLGHEMKNNSRIFVDLEYEFRKRIIYPKYASDHMYFHSFTINIGVDFPL